jgi:hypothetical protein
LIPQFYDPHARITRSSDSFAFSERPPAEILPFDPQISVVKIFDSQFVPIPGIPSSAIITVFGSIADCPFSQRFSFIFQASRWFVVDDAFFLFDREPEELLGAEESPLPVLAASVPHIRKVATFERSTVPAEMRPRAIPLNDFAVDRTITILNLSNNYKGNEVVAHYAQFGLVTNHHFTHNTVYIEFESPDCVRQAAAARPLVHQGATAAVKPGIEVRDLKTVGRHNR